MFSISQDFAPPFKLISPFFILGSLFYLLASVFIFFFTSDNLLLQDPKVLSFVHLFLLGFVMMVIFGAMAQLIPVVLEVGHSAVELFYVIWPLLGIGTILMVVGFLGFPALLPYGGTVVLISMMIFVMEIFSTIKKVKKLNIVMGSVLISNTFLFFGIIFGLVMALGYAGTIEVDIMSLLRSHVYLVIGGYIAITLMGLSVVLLPMFGLSHGFSMRPLEVSITLMSTSVVLVVISSFVKYALIEYTAYTLALASMVFYFYLVYTIFKTRARKELDIYAISLIYAYFSMLVALGLGVAYLASSYEPLLLASGWLIFFGFFGFAITGHIYKIVPFLVWFERFSPLVGKEKVPMLADMLPKKSSHAQFVFCAVGVSIIAVAILLQDDTLMKAGASFLVVGASALVRNVFYMINFK
ncbi:hypothetical protein SMGD1_0293 [Sulfurimonas gotlandica GD1]|uniref:Uncharacterized protein n=1 Tax=Sulfurimonas gotlandica (strain DSM 19862 / JCM 16533 / GD1) TaxID=929558 RepID=B6BNL7_SULGG|nr:hypothetical protein [Sulfurimonas gotlandica]EDZ61240.1 conserved hypothetical protein [Sulfurimonas gotlandica GD1]EHP28820.1 hypothetical protein SMGD1_0293 [Sulfurimonas gotlandica GD1]